LYGAAGRGLDAEAEARIAVDPNPFPQWSGYTFGDAVETFREQIVPIGHGLTDEDGLYRTTIDLAGDAYGSSSPLRLFVTAGVAEPGGRYVRDSLFLPLRSETAYVGFDPAFDGGYAKRNSSAEIDLIAVDADGNRIALDGTIALIREDYDYQWYREDGRWRYRRDRRDRTVDEARVTLGADAPYRFTQALPYGQYRIQFTTESGVRFSHQFGSGWRRADGNADAPDRIEMGLSQAEVSPGDTVVMTVNAPFSGTGELVIADRAVRTVQTVRIEAGESEIRLPLGRDWTTDLYAMLTVYGPGAETQPQRAVGLVHIPMDRSAQRLDVALDVPDRIRPRTEQEVVVKVAGLDSEAGFLTLAAVDSGILQITDYDPPSPEDHYFGKFAFPIDVFDDYARMLAPFSGADRVGGDSLGGAGLSVVPTQIVSLFEGPVSFEGGETTLTLDIPDFQGELTLMAVAWTDIKLGSASTRMIVRDPVTAQLALPRFLAPGDRAVATVAMDNVDGQVGDYVVTVDASGAEVGRVERRLDRGARSEDGIDVAATGLGVTTYTLAASGPDFSVERDYRIETRAAVMPETRTRFVQVAVGESATLDFASDLDGLAAGTTELMVSASHSPGLDPRPLLASLQRYPYGCTEQTISVALPLLLSETVDSLPGVSDADRRESVQQAVDTLLSRQSSNGAFGLWSRDDGQASPYLQLYASDFILLAEAQGYDVPGSAKARTLDTIRALSQLDRNAPLALDYDFGLNSSSPDYELRAAERAAYALALMARHDRVKKTDLLYLDRRFGERLRPSIAQSQLGYALAALGETERAQAAFARAADRIAGNEISYYDSATRNAAALVALGRDLPDEVLTEALLALSVEDSAQLNTHEKAWLLRALAERSGGDAPFAGDGWTAVGHVSHRDLASDARSLDLVNDTDSPVWVQITVSGLPDGPIRARAQGATLNKSLYTLSGRPMVNLATSRGERIVVVLDVEAGSRADAMWVIADLLPAGFEIETMLTPDDAGSDGPFDWLGELSQMDMAEARDDRFVTSWRTTDRYGDRARRAAYVLRATTQGDFALPGAHLEDMYRPERMATTAGRRIAVMPAPS
ncbi:MAG: alpha-2-macroglobulin family protein, partial [Litorimonas sp.]